MNNNWGLIGHKWAVSMLKRHVANGLIRHAYLLTGPDGIGRRTLAIRLAQALNCPNPLNPGEPCMDCRDCLQFDRQEHPDLTFVEAEEGGLIIRVDQIRQVQHSLSLTPFQARYRIAILNRFEQANPNAANALLKTLEEPPDQVIMILTANNPDLLLPTVVSRCETFRLRPLPLEELIQGLEQKYAIPKENAILLSHISGGRPGYAIRLHNEPRLLDDRNLCLEDLLTLMKSGRVKRFAYAENAAQDREKLVDQLYVWSSFWRDVLLICVGSSAPLTNIDRADQLSEIANRLNGARVIGLIKSTEQTQKWISKYVNIRLALENLLLEFPYI